ncbi:DoxX family protein [Candidatus Pacearchaeota archaeon]|nr:DoxX family protein [Candidatus Pacearchaeota archaeon]
MNLKHLQNFLDKNKSSVYSIFRITVALLFFQHGAQKLFGLFGGTQLDVMNLFAFNFSSLLVIAGLIEFFGGILIAIGLLTRFAAFLSVCNMIGAYLLVHASQSWVPIVNRGELALFYLVAFLLILFYGPGKWALDNKLFKNRY